MTRALLTLTLLTTVAQLSGHSQTQVPERLPGRLLIDVVALGRDGRPISDLRRDEVEVWIGGYRVPVETFIAITPATDERSARAIVLLLDDITLPLVLAERARQVARRFVSQMTPADRMAIVTLSGTATETTSSVTQLRKSIDAYNIRLSGVTPFDVLGARVLTTLTAIARALESIPDRRKTIVAIGAAWLFDTPIPRPALGRDLREEWVAAMRALALANANMYLIEPAGVGMSSVPPGGSSGLAHETGGHAFVSTNDLDGAADAVMREAGSYYLIGVADPPVQRTADLRELKVRVLRRGITVRTRNAVPGRTGSE